MNKSLIKLLGIFLILLFCLSPLGAIDLDQGDNSTQINDNNTDFKDLNDTIIADDDANPDDKDMEIKSNNETDDIKAIDEVEIQNISVNDSNSTKNLQAIDPKLSMEIEDCVYGETPILKIYFKYDGFGYTDLQKVIVQGDNYTHNIYASFWRGCNKLELPNDMRPGSYKVTYTFVSPSGHYKSVTVTAMFTIHKRDSAIRCSVHDVNYGQKPVVRAICGEHLEKEYVYITSPQFSKEYKYDASIYYKEVSIDENLTPGKYTCNVFYPGDSTHDPQNTTLTFNVNKLYPKLTVKAKDSILNGDNLSVEIRANETINADVTCKLKDDTKTVHLVNGVGSMTIDSHNLSAGYYQLSTCFEGDDFFKKDTVVTNFKVMDEPKLRMHVDDSSSRADDLHVVVDADKEFNGNVTITLNNRVWTKNIEVVNGHGEDYYPGGDYPGNYTAKAKTDGNDLFIAGNCSTTYEVKGL